MAQISSNFEGLADNYSQNRPQYPQRLIGRLLDRMPEGPLTVVDVAAGTGISTRVLAKVIGTRAGIVGIEPSEDMRRRALQDTQDRPNVRYADGTAEALGFADGSVDLVFVGEALHWFDRQKFYAEVDRVLKPGGVLAIARNTRNWRKSEFLSEYEDFHERNLPGFSREQRDNDVEGELAAQGWVARAETLEEEWIRPMKTETFLGMAQSSSKVTQALRNVGWDDGIRQLTEMASRHVDRDGFLVLPYLSVMVVAVKTR